jgi:hypothetical protein
MPSAVDSWSTPVMYVTLTTASFVFAHGAKANMGEGKNPSLYQRSRTETQSKPFNFSKSTLPNLKMRAAGNRSPTGGMVVSCPGRLATEALPVESMINQALLSH